MSLTYLDAKDTVELQIKNLESAVSSLITSSMTSIEVKDKIKLQNGEGSAVGQFRVGGVNSALQFTNDSGVTWTDITDGEWLKWDQYASYSSGDTVLYSGTLYNAVAGVSGTAPTATNKWRQITVGSTVFVVRSMADLQAALGLTVSDVVIYVTGNLALSGSVTTTISRVTIYSDEAVSLSGSLNLTMPSGGCVYWHSNGTRVTTLSLTMSTGSMYIDRMTVSDTLTLTENVFYQRIDGYVAGGTKSIWDDVDPAGTYVPRTLEALGHREYRDSMKFYVNWDTDGYVYGSDLLSQMAAKAAAYFHVDSVGDGAPSETWSKAQGYVYYDSTNGDFYVRQESSWGPGIHIKGGTGSSGSNGSNGVSPTVAVTSIAGGNRLTITDVSHPTGQTVDIMDGSSGTTPTVSVGTVSTLDPGSSAYVRNTGTTSAAVFEFGIPRGSTGSSGKGVTDTVYPVALRTAASIGLSIEAARADHVHPTTGLLTVPDGGSSGQFLEKTDNGWEWSDVSVQLATTAPKPLGSIASEGSATSAARADHVHPLTGVIPDPGNGTSGQLLEKTSTGYAWTSVSISLSDASPKSLADTASAGTAVSVARADHVHPTTGLLTEPTTGTSGQFLMKTANSWVWETVSAGAGDMLMASYDYNSDNVVNSADMASSAFSAGSANSAAHASVADAAPWTGLTGSPAENASLASVLSSYIANPAGGTEGQALVKTADAVAWSTIQGAGDMLKTEFVGAAAPSSVQSAVSAGAVAWDNVTGHPTVSSVYNNTVSFTQGTTLLGTITLNQNVDSTINIPATPGGTVSFGDIAGDPYDNTSMSAALSSKTDNASFLAHSADTVAHITTAERSYWSSKITPPTGGTSGQVLAKTDDGYAWSDSALPGSGTITIYQGTVSKGSFNVNQNTDTTITLAAGGGEGGGDMYKSDYDTDSDGVVDFASHVKWAASSTTTTGQTLAASDMGRLFYSGGKMLTCVSAGQAWSEGCVNSKYPVYVSEQTGLSDAVKGGYRCNFGADENRIDVKYCDRPVYIKCDTKLTKVDCDAFNVLNGNYMFLYDGVVGSHWILTSNLKFNPRTDTALATAMETGGNAPTDVLWPTLTLDSDVYVSDADGWATVYSMMSLEDVDLIRNGIGAFAYADTFSHMYEMAYYASDHMLAAVHLGSSSICESVGSDTEGHTFKLYNNTPSGIDFFPYQCFSGVILGVAGSYCYTPAPWYGSAVDLGADGFPRTYECRSNTHTGASCLADMEAFAGSATFGEFIPQAQFYHSNGASSLTIVVSGTTTPHTDFDNIDGGHLVWTLRMSWTEYDPNGVVPAESITDITPTGGSGGGDMYKSDFAVTGGASAVISASSATLLNWAEQSNITAVQSLASSAASTIVSSALNLN